MSNEKEALNKLSLGRAFVLDRAPYIASTLLEMTPVIVDHPDATMGVTRGLVLYVNGRWLLSDPEMEQDAVTGACLYHECEHPLRGMDRLDALPDKKLANIAGDEAINDNLRDENWVLPSWVVYPEKFNHPSNLTLEQYYELLSRQMDEQRKELEQFMDDCMNRQTPEAVDGQGADKKGSGKGQGKNQDGSGQGAGWQKKVGAGACGSAAGNGIDEVESELDAKYGKGDAEVDAVRRSTLDQIEEHMQQFGRGSVPGRFEQLLETRIKAPDVDWRKELKRAFRRTADVIISGAMDYSMRRPSIGGSLVGVSSAGLIEREVRVCVAEDTSLSMGTEQLQQARNEGYHLLKKLGLREAWHLQADSEVQKVQKIKLRQMPKVSFAGRGGTDFRPVFEEVLKMRPRPNLMVFFTDGDGPAPVQPPPGIAVIWCIVRTPYARKPARWGTVVVCDKMQELRDPY